MAHFNEELFQKLKIKLLESVVDFNYKTLHKHSHPGKLDIHIPIDKFNNKELDYLRENESNFKYLDNSILVGEIYPCYKVKKKHVYTNEINLLAFKA
jgi:hypothetical protein